MKAETQLSRGTRTDRSPAFGPHRRRRFERRRECIVASEGIKVGIGAGQRAILGIHRDRPFDVGHRFSELSALRVSNGKHVQRVVVVGIFVSDEPEVRDGFVVASTVQCQR